MYNNFPQLPASVNEIPSRNFSLSQRGVAHPGELAVSVIVSFLFPLYDIRALRHLAKTVIAPCEYLISLLFLPV